MSFFGNRRQTESSPAAATPKPTVSQLPVGGQQPVGFETVLGANSVMEGVLKSAANVRLDGTFTGTLEITGNVLVGETAKINADIHARNVSIAGAVRGNVSGKKVQLLRTGRIWGDIRAQALTTEEGAFIDGKITMISKDPPVSEQEEPVEVVEDTANVVEAVEVTESATGDEETVAEIVASVDEVAADEDAAVTETETSAESEGESSTEANPPADTATENSGNQPA